LLDIDETISIAIIFSKNSQFQVSGTIDSFDTIGVGDSDRVVIRAWDEFGPEISMILGDNLRIAGASDFRWVDS
jgi:hypothetical protein